jgi:hypothetical protein
VRAILDNAPTKRCSRCFTRKPVDQFHADGRTLDGLSNDCGACTGRQRTCPNCGNQFTAHEDFTYCTARCFEASRPALLPVRDRKARVIRALRRAEATEAEITAAKLAFAQPDRDLPALERLETRLGLTTTAPPQPKRRRSRRPVAVPIPLPTPRIRWGLGLVCDCLVAKPVGGRQCEVCKHPVVALMDPELREVMATKAPQSATQNIDRRAS